MNIFKPILKNFSQEWYYYFHLIYVLNNLFRSTREQSTTSLQVVKDLASEQT